MSEPSFWDDPEKAKKTTRALAGLKQDVAAYESLVRRLEDALDLVTMAEEEGDEAIGRDILQEVARLEGEVRAYELRSLLDGEYDRNAAIMSFHAGAGGTESQDWAQMLLRMYTRWAEEKGYTVEVLDLLPGEEAGIKNAAIRIDGEYAYGFLKSEKGVHRLVRISPFDANARRHTSFAMVEVLPDLPEDAEVEINPDDLRVDTFRSSGRGGQHVNKTDSAVRITHIPTGIVVSCQNERSQHQNRATAMRILRAKLLELKLREREQELAALKGQHTEIGWGNQIRSYVFQPYSLVKDHRTQVEVGDVQSVMDGEIDPFIYGYLRKTKQGEHTGDRVR